MDQAIYGKVKNITDKEIYTDSFQLPKDFEVPTYRKIELEAPYHELTNGGHITEVNLEENATVEEFMKTIETMKKHNIGCCTISKTKVDN